jgi:hypothetical protein
MALEFTQQLAHTVPFYYLPSKSFFRVTVRARTVISTQKGILRQSTPAWSVSRGDFGRLSPHNDIPLSYTVPSRSVDTQQNKL